MTTSPKSTPGVGTICQPRENLDPDFHVFIHNDDITPMEFVVAVLMQIFHHPHHAATQLMLQAHRSGRVIVATLPLEVAELKRDQVHALARPRGYPLTCSVERA